MNPSNFIIFVASELLGAKSKSLIYIYIYRERERERESKTLVHYLSAIP